jgi:magnesium chelatase family protein
MAGPPGAGKTLPTHRSVLFLNELPEFGSRTLEVLRQPMEDQVVTISRVAGTLSFPAAFMFIALMNPCPCGYFSDPVNECTCSIGMVSRCPKRIPLPGSGQAPARC